jgi:hypothetical protein
MEDMRNGICAMCGHHEVLVAAAHDYYDSSTVTPIAVTRVAPKLVGRPQVMGALAMYVCRKCGFTQWFAADPAAIPIGEEHGTALVPGND